MRRSCCDQAGPAHDGAPEFGPQHDGDSVFAARMRFHQSWYRACVLRVPWGTGPTRHSARPYGNMLTCEDGEKRGLNFLTPAVFELAEERLKQKAGVIEPYRLLRNMLSSQPMCFNLFGPLCLDLDLATRLFRAVLPDQVGRVGKVRIEWAPKPKKDYLNDHTAFDAFVEYHDPREGRGFLGVETKLTEPFTEACYGADEYARWTRRGESPWPSASWDLLPATAHNQLWRDHMLVEAVRSDADRGYAAGALVLVRHPQDDDCAEAVRGYKGLLKRSDSSFIDLTLDRVVDAWAPLVEDGPERQWLDAFRLRYLGLDASEEAWREYRSKRRATRSPRTSWP